MQNGCGGVQRVLFTAKELRERMKNPVDILFLDHPRSVGETYLQHQRFALRVSGQLMMAAAGAMIHALCQSYAKRAPADASGHCINWCNHAIDH